MKFLNEFIDFKKTTLVIGDFNACPERKPNNEVSSFFSRPKFNQLVTFDNDTYRYQLTPAFSQAVNRANSAADRPQGRQ